MPHTSVQRRKVHRVVSLRKYRGRKGSHRDLRVPSPFPPPLPPVEDLNRTMLLVLLFLLPSFCTSALRRRRRSLRVQPQPIRNPVPLGPFALLPSFPLLSNGYFFSSLLLLLLLRSDAGSSPPTTKYILGARDIEKCPIIYQQGTLGMLLLFWL